MSSGLEIFQQRRRIFQEHLPPHSVAVIFGGESQIRSNDVHHPFRVDSDFVYLTGFEEEDSILVLTNDASVLFLRPRDPERETWNGLRLGVERATASLGVDHAMESGKFRDELPKLLRNRRHLFYFYGKSETRDVMMLGATGNLLARSRAGEFGPTEIHHPSEILHEMRLIKNAAEIAAMQESADITGRAHRRLMEEVRPGMREFELHAIILHEFRRNGAVEAYPSIVAAGKNACILHYIENNAEIREGSLVLVDAGSEKNFWAADVTRTFPADGHFQPAQKDLYQIVLDAQKEAIARTVAGVTLESIHQGAVRRLVAGLIDLKLLSGSADEAIERKTFHKYYMHKTGHWLGMDVHDVGSYYRDGKPRPLVDGMVTTVEPGLYVPIDDETAPPEMRGVGIRIEDDVVVRGSNPLVLTAGIPKEISDMEALMERGRKIEYV